MNRKAIRESSAVDNIGTIYGLTVGINNVPTGIDWFFDNFQVDYYERNHDWVAGANYRIEEYRKRPILFDFKVIFQS